MFKDWKIALGQLWIVCALLSFLLGGMVSTLCGSPTGCFHSMSEILISISPFIFLIGGFVGITYKKGEEKPVLKFLLLLPLISVAALLYEFLPL